MGAQVTAELSQAFVRVKPRADILSGGASAESEALHPGSRTYLPQLDGLRAVAVALVIAIHADKSLRMPGGFVGVDIFFVLSAFLITGLLVREWEKSDQIDIGRFYLRRALRLMPPFLMMLAVYVAAAPLLWPGHPHLRDALIAGLYLSDYAIPLIQAPVYLAHTWSLAVEEQFYLLWPLILLPLMRTGRPIVLLALGWLALTLWRCGFSDWLHFYYRFDTHSSGLALGALLFFAVRSGGLRFHPVMAWAALLVIAWIAWTAQITSSQLTITAVEIAAALLIGCLVTDQAGLVGRVMVLPPMVMLGKLSYSIYLWHYPFAAYAREHWSYPVALAATIAFSVSAAFLSYHTIEAWSRRKRQLC